MHMGLDGFVWFVGVVEDRNDPEFLGRVKVIYLFLQKYGSAKSIRYLTNRWRWRYRDIIRP